MKITFDSLPETIISNFKGGQNNTIAKLYTDSLGKIMFGKLEPNSSIGFHKHETSSEIIYIVKGEGKVLYDNETEYVNAGDCHYCPKTHSHSLINESKNDLIFFAVVPEQ